MANELTHRMRLFCAGIAAGKSQHDAGISAGYKASNVDNTASKLMDRAVVREEIARIAGEAVAQAIGSRVECLDTIWKNMKAAEAEKDRSAVRSLAELWLKAEGHLIDRREVRTDTVVELEWDSQAIVSGGTDES